MSSTRPASEAGRWRSWSIADFLKGVIDATTTEVADYLVGGILPCTEDRFGAFARTRIPVVVSTGALDMVNFGPRETVPEKFARRKFHVHNAQVTLMRTTPEENRAAGAWIAERLNKCEGPLRFVLPLGGVSALDAPGQPFHDAEANAALFNSIRATFRPTKMRKLVELRVQHQRRGIFRCPCHEFP